MSSYFNDSPIETASDDRYGVTPFAKAIARSILTIDKPIGTTIAINGPWGVGKSSVVNLIRQELEAIPNDELTVVDFKCWWYRGEEALTLAFFQELNRALKDGLGDKVKNLVPEIGRHILQAGPVIGTAVSLATTSGIGALASGSATFLKRFFPDTKSVEKTFRQLSATLESQSRRFLVIIDDIDRLSPDEAVAIFRLVKSVGRLPNIMYLLVFDRQLADKAVAERFPSEGPHFLEKIIQAGFELPAPASADLHSALLSAVETICGSPPEDAVVRFMNLFYDIVAPYLTSPRHVTRLINAMSVTWPAIEGQVDRADYLAMECLRLYEPALFHAIRRERDAATGHKVMGLPDRTADTVTRMLQGIPESEHERLKIALRRLFPVFENTHYGDGFSQMWDEQRRLCIDKYFDTYFRLSLSDETLPLATLNDLISRAADTAHVQATLLGGLEQVRKNGRSMVPVMLTELTTHARRVPVDQVGPLIASVFAIADRINREADKEPGFPGADAHLRLHWLIRRLTGDRIALADRSALYLKASEVSEPEWLIGFVSSAVDDYENSKGREADENCLVEETALPALKALALAAFVRMAADGTLLRSERLMWLLYRWRDLSSDDGAAMRQWVADQMDADTNLAIFAKALTGESWTTGMGGFGGSLGDRVSKRNVRASISADFDLFDLEVFRTRLEGLVAAGALPEADLDAIRTFLAAWAASRRGDD